MKKKVLATLMAAALAASMPVSALAAGSITGSGVITGTGSGSSGGSSSGTVANKGNGTSTSDGQSLTTNGAGSKTADVNASFATGAAETAGLPASVVSSIQGINSGSDLDKAVGNPDLAGYAALTKTAAIVLQNTTDKNVANQEAEVSLYIPNLMEGLQNVKILCYENATGTWKVLEPTAIDFSKKTVTFKMFGSGTVTVIHK